MMKRRTLVSLVAAGALALTACGAEPSTTGTAGTDEATTTTAGSGTGSATGPADPAALQAQADRVLEDLFEADRDLDYDTIAGLTSRAVAARYRNQELLATIDDLDDRLIVPAMASVTVTSDLEVLEPSDGTIETTGEVTVTYVDDEGNEDPYTYTDIVFEQDGNDLLVADWRVEGDTLPASSAFLDTSEADPEVVEDLTVELEPGYRNPDGDPGFVEYLFTVTNDSDHEFEVTDVEITTPDDETFPIQFGLADDVEPGATAPARVGFEGPSVPVSGGQLTISIEDDENVFLVFLDVPAFLDEDGEPEEPKSIELDDVEFSASGTLGDAADPASADPEVLQEVTDAVAFRDSLLDIAATEVDPSDLDGAWGIPDAWTAAVPGLELVGFQIEATPLTVSGFGITGPEDGSSEGLPFAVVDSSGTCAGGAVMGRDGRPTDFVAVDLADAATCNAAAVIDAVGLS